MKIQTKFSMIAMAAMLMMQGCGAKQENYDRLLDPNKLITLETGVSGEPDQRYLVQAVLVEGQ